MNKPSIWSGLRLTFVCLLIIAPVVLAFRDLATTKNFRVVRDGVLYRAGQMTPGGLERIVHDHGIRTVISLRDASDANDRALEDYCNKMDIRHVRIEPKSWLLTDGVAPVDEGVNQFLEIMKDRRNHPVLVHCFAGVHRSGAYCAIYRMQFEGWSNDDAMAELKACGYENLDRELDIRGYLEAFRPRRTSSR